MGLMPVVIGQERDFGEFKWQSREALYALLLSSSNTLAEALAASVGKLLMTF